MQRIKHWIVFASILAALFVQTKANADDGKVQRGVASIPAEVRAQYLSANPQRKSELARQYAALGVYFDVPEFWSSITTESNVLPAIYYFKEPLTPDMLNALERLWPKMRQATRLDTAMLLYRYNRPLGRMFLSQLVKGTDYQALFAAQALALNRDTSALPAIIRVLNFDDENELAASPDLLDALGRWPDSRIKTAILNRFRIAVQKREEAGILNYIKALALQNSRDAIPLIRRVYAQDKASGQLVQSNELIYKATLIRLHDREEERLSASFIQQFTLMQRRRLLAYGNTEQLAIAGNSASINLLRQLIQQYLNTRKKPDPRWGKTTTVADEPHALAFEAAEQLASIKHRPSFDLIKQLLLRAKKDGLTRDSQKRVALALINLDAVQSRSLVESIMGKEWVNVILSLRNLKKIPNTFLDACLPE